MSQRKILVVDGTVGFTGGVGIAEEWTGNCEDPDHWRDTHLRIEGPAVRDLLGGFQQNWSEATRTVSLMTTPPTEMMAMRQQSIYDSFGTE